MACSNMGCNIHWRLLLPNAFRKVLDQVDILALSRKDGSEPRPMEEITAFADLAYGVSVPGAGTKLGSLAATSLASSFARLLASAYSSWSREFPPT
jgi:hypothetical protein